MKFSLIHEGVTLQFAWTLQSKVYLSPEEKIEFWAENLLANEFVRSSLYTNLTHFPLGAGTVFVACQSPERMYGHFTLYFIL